MLRGAHLHCRVAVQISRRPTPSGEDQKKLRDILDAIEAIEE